MRVLHISLGNPAQHEGGLNKYCFDLMNSQRKLGDSVYLLYPGSILYKSKKIKYIDDNTIRVDNALPVAINYGIDHPQRYMKSTDKKYYLDVLDKIKPDIIHIHSIMGIHKEFFEACKEKGIPMVFTTHDYYPLCLKCNFINKIGNLCVNNRDPEKCAICNINSGLNWREQLLIQSKLYQAIKSNRIVNQLKTRIKTKGKQEKEDMMPSQMEIDNYNNLIRYYKDILSLMTIIHCNSEVSRNIYRVFFPDIVYKIIPLVHSDIKIGFHQRINKERIEISYFGGPNIHKGYNQLLKAIEFLPKDDSWHLNLFGGGYTNVQNEKISIKGKYEYTDLESILHDTDLVLFPSQWPETLGFVVLEALAYRIPVVCSNIAGSSIYLKKINECLYDYKDPKQLSEKIEYFINYNNYIMTQKKIDKMKQEFDMIDHTKRIEKVYKSAIVIEKKRIKRENSI